MAVPVIVAGAAAIAARLAAKKAAQELTKTTAKKALSKTVRATKNADRINTAAAKGRTIGSPVARVNPQGKLKVQEYMTGKPVKGKIKNIKDTAQLVEYNAGSAKKLTSLKYGPKELRGIKGRTPKPTTPKVSTKPRANRTRVGQKTKGK
jgi:hypothetical protein